MRTLLSLSIVFIFIYPIFPKSLPIPFDRVLQLLGMCVLLGNRKDLHILISSKTFWKFIRITIVLLILALIAQLQVTFGFDLYFVKVILDTFFSFFSAYFVFWVLRKFYKNVDIAFVLYFIILVAIVQVFLSAFFFVNPDYFDVYVSFLKEETNEGLLSRLSTLNKRFIGVGSQFFSGVIKYGFAFFSILILPYIQRTNFFPNKLVYWSSVLIIAVGGILTGRTFFVAIVLGILMISFLNAKSIFSFISVNLKALFIIIISLPILYLVASSILDPERLDLVSEFVFELFINFFTEGELATSSSNVTIEMYKFPDNMTTWIFGDGLMFESGGYYMRSDVGYVRLIFYFGLPSTIFFTYVIYRYYKIFSAYLKNKALNVFILFSALWIFILNFKGLVFESHYFVLFLLVLLLTKEQSAFISPKTT